jgi:hypothetical protein
VAYVNTARSLQFATAWSAPLTAPGLNVTTAGTLTSGQELGTWATGGEPGTSVNKVTTTTFASGGFMEQLAGLKSGEDITVDLFSSFTASEVHAIINTTLGGLGAYVYCDLKATTAVRSATNPSFVAYGFISSYKPFGGNVGDAAVAQLVMSISGKFAYLTS